jgi:hypothetical protein
MAIKAPKRIQASAADPYYVVEDDHDGILEVVGSPVIFRLGLPLGFYTTIVNIKGGTIVFRVEAGALLSTLGGASISTQFDQCTIYRSADGFIAPTL